MKIFPELKEKLKRSKIFMGTLFILRSIKYFLIVRRLESRNTYYVLSLPHIGDLVYTMSFLKKFKEENNIKHLTAIVTSKGKEMCECYDDICDDYLIMPEKKIFNLCRFCEILKSVSVFDKDNIISTAPWQGNMKMCSIPGIDAVNTTKVGIYQLDSQTVPQKPTIKKLNSKEFEDFCSIEKKVIISPYAYSATAIDLSFWEELVAKLNNLSYTVYTNTINKNEVISGSKQLSCSISDLLSFLNECDYLIGLRSGVFDLAVMTECKIIALYNNYEAGKFYSLLHWKTNDSIYEQFEEPDLDGIVDYVIKNE